MSASPLTRLPVAIGMFVYGTIVREMSSHSLLSVNGMTGCTLSRRYVVDPRPPPELKLNCSGNDVRLAMGFCDAFAKADSLCAWLMRGVDASAPMHAAKIRIHVWLTHTLSVDRNRKAT